MAVLGLCGIAAWLGVAFRGQSMGNLKRQLKEPSQHAMRCCRGGLLHIAAHYAGLGGATSVHEWKHQHGHSVSLQCRSLAMLGAPVNVRVLPERVAVGHSRLGSCGWISRWAVVGAGLGLVLVHPRPDVQVVHVCKGVCILHPFGLPGDHSHL